MANHSIQLKEIDVIALETKHQKRSLIGNCCDLARNELRSFIYENQFSVVKQCQSIFNYTLWSKFFSANFCAIASRRYSFLSLAGRLIHASY